MKKMRKFGWLILLLFISACSPKSFSENDLAKVQLTEKDLPQGFVKSDESAIQGIASLASNLQKYLLKGEPSGKTINASMFTREDENADLGIVSFDYFSLSAAEKTQLSETTRKKDVATCCELIAIFMGGSGDSCTNADLIRLISVLPKGEGIGEGSLECSLNIQGKSYYELGFFYKQNVLSFIFEGYAQYDPNDVITSPFELTSLLILKADKLTTAGSG
jgi:hypothetical protein